jgi:hypothetical protein
VVSDWDLNIEPTAFKASTLTAGNVISPVTGSSSGGSKAVISSSFARARMPTSSSDRAGNHTFRPPGARLPSRPRQVDSGSLPAAEHPKAAALGLTNSGLRSAW